MALEPAFTEAFLHALARPFSVDDPWSSHSVLGNRLRPFCLWHRLLLAQTASPLVTGKRVSPADLKRAIEICRCRYQEMPRQRRFSCVAFWKLLGKGFEREIAAFREYVADFETFPEYDVIPLAGCTERIRGQAPEYLRLVAETIAVTGCSLERAWEMPTGEVRWWYAIGLRKLGADLDFATEDQRESIARAQEDLKKKDPARYDRFKAAAAKFGGN